MQPAQLQCLQHGLFKQVTRETDGMNVLYVLRVEGLVLTV